VTTLLICYDGSERADHAISVAASIFPGADAHVLNVWEPMERIVARYSALGPYLGESIGDADAGIAAEASDAAGSGAQLATNAGLAATPRAVPLLTTVWEAVLQVADDVDADVIITGTRSLHGMREALSNTLSHALLQHSRRAVLAIPMPAGQS